MVKFKFISIHYDIHLAGLCLYNGELSRFKCNYPEWDEENDKWDDVYAKIFKLSLRDKIRWKLRQWLFEKCVGYHWSYKNNKRCDNYRIRKPKWLHNFCLIFIINTK